MCFILELIFGKIEVAVPTFNRPRYVELMAQSLMMAKGVQDGMKMTAQGQAGSTRIGTGPRVEVVVFDDESSEYGKEQLAEWFTGATIVRHKNNVGPDENTRLIMQWFLTSGVRLQSLPLIWLHFASVCFILELTFDETWQNNAVVIADSDMMYHPSWLMTLQEVLPEMHGVVTLYNAVTHKAFYCDEDVCVKDTVGSAGVVFCRSVVPGILDAVVLDSNGVAKVGGGNGFDWGFSRYFVRGLTYATLTTM